MNTKLLLGIGVPLIVIVVLVALSTVKTGLTAEEKLADSLSMKSFTENQQGKTLLTVTVTNDYFLPRSYALPKLTACLYDSSGKQQGQSVYAQWTTIEKVLSPGVDIILYPETEGIEAGALNLAPNTKKSAYYYTTSSYIYSIWKFDKLLLIENADNTNYNFCYKLTPEDVQKAREIPLKDDLGYNCPASSSLDCSYNGKDRNLAYCQSNYLDWIRTKCPGITIGNY